MSLTDFFHGVETVTTLSGTRPIQTVRSSVIYLIGTAPDANDSDFPLNQPVLLNNRSGMSRIGMTGTLGGALDGIFDQIGALVCVQRVPDASNINQALQNIIGGVDHLTGDLTGLFTARSCESLLGVSPMLFAAPGFTHQRPIGVSEIVIDNQGSGYTLANVVFSGGGAIVQARGHALIVSGKITEIVLDAPGFGYVTAPTLTITGDGSGATAHAKTGPSANPVVGAMLPVAEDMRAHILADGPSTTDSAAFDSRADWGSRRIFMTEPNVSGWSSSSAEYVEQAPSARVAGLIAKVDNEYGFWESPSNKEINGIGGLSRPIDTIGRNSRANLLNEHQISTFKRDNGWRLWGNRTTSSEPKFSFLSVSRTADVIDISIAKAHQWAVDRAITRQYFTDVSSSVNAYLSYLRTRGGILGGSCWVDPSLNAQADIAKGNATFDYDFTPPYPAERLTFRSHLVDSYISNLFA